MKLTTLLLTLLISASLIGTAQALTFVNSNSKDKPTSKVSTSDTKAFNELWESTKTKKIKVTKPFSHSLWTAENRYAETIGPEWTSKLRSMYNTQWNTWHFTADMNNDGILDFVYTPMFQVENLHGSGSVKTEDLSDAEHGHCRDEVCRGESALPSIYFGRSDGTWVYGTGAFVDNRENPGYRIAHPMLLTSTEMVVQTYSVTIHLMMKVLDPMALKNGTDTVIVTTCHNLTVLG